MANYWTPTHQAAIVEYITCITATTSGATRHDLFNRVLHQPLTHMCRQALYSSAIPVNDDNVQDLLTHLYAYVIDRCDRSKINGFLQFAYTACRNYAVTFIYHRRIKKDKAIEFVPCDVQAESSQTSDQSVIQQDTRIQIIEQLDHMIKVQKVFNKTNTIFLLLLRQYLLDNDFDATGFRSYAMQVMNIKRSTFAGIASRLRIVTKLFRDDEDNFCE